ncbi:MAG: hypothetical protein ACU85V_12550 [Gammaproteobacteria bacterium]
MSPVRCAVLIGLALATLPAPAAELGRLFLSPKERAALERARHARPEAPAVAPAPASELLPGIEFTEPQPGSAPGPVRVDGYVARSEGPPTVWLNGMDSSGGGLGELGIDPRRVHLEAERVRVPVGAAPNAVLLKPGQEFDPETEQVSDGYERRAGLAGEDGEE